MKLELLGQAGIKQKPAYFAGLADFVGFLGVNGSGGVLSILRNTSSGFKGFGAGFFCGVVMVGV